MIDWTKPVMTTEGNRPIRVLCMDRKQQKMWEDYSIMTLVTTFKGSEEAIAFSHEGRSVGGSYTAMNVPEVLDLEAMTETVDGNFLAEILRKEVRVSGLKLMVVLLTSKMTAAQAVQLYREDGYPYPNNNSNLRLVNTPPTKKTIWLNIYSDGNAFHYDTRSSARINASKIRPHSTIKVTYEEGQIDD